MSARWAAAVVLAVFFAWCGAPPAVAGGFAGLGDDASGFAKVVPGRAITFPADFGAHPDYRIEWWYVTANLKDRNGADYGVQWTLFRQALEPGPQRAGWESQQVWMGHAAVTSERAHRFAERLARGGIGQAGVTASPFQAWIDDWSFASVETRDKAISAATLSAKGTGFSYSLALTTSRSPVLQGDGGFSLKSDQGQASYYFSQPFFDVSGSIALDGRDIAVTGRAWMDREWSSQPLSADQKGWDWLSLHLPQGEKLMLFQLRGVSETAYLSGNWIGRDGAVTPLARGDIVLTAGERRRVAGRTLPAAWHIEVKSRGLKIETTPLNPDSWMETTFSYWEGPIRFHGSHDGEGYLEMTGY